MKKLILALAFILAGAVNAFGQSTTVSGTITDAGAQAWAGGSYQFQFVPNPQFPTGPYTWTGGALNQVISGALDGAGHYSQSLPSSSAISPQGSKWILQVTPNATSSSFSTAPTTITGGTQTLNATPPAISVASIGPLSRAYADGEISGGIIGSEYYNVTTSKIRVCTAITGQVCTTWADVGTGAAGSVTACGGAANTQMAFFTTATNLCGDATLTFDSTSKSFQATGSTTALQRIGAGANFLLIGGSGTGSNEIALAAAEPGAVVAIGSVGDITFTAGAANPFKLPTATAATGNFLLSDGGNPQLTSWSTGLAWNPAGTLTLSTVGGLLNVSNGSISAQNSGTAGIAFFSTGTSGLNQIKVGGNTSSVGNFASIGANEPGAQIFLGANANINISSVTGSYVIGALANSSGAWTYTGKTSGSAILGVADVSGTPNRLNLPTTTGTNGQVLATDGGTPQQTSWTTLATAPQNTPGVANNFITAYNSTTGAFTQAQPATANLSDIGAFVLNTSGTNSTFSGAGAASVSSVKFTGTLFTGGSATTTFPNVLFNPGNNALPTSWVTTGTAVGFVMPSGCTTGLFWDAHVASGGSAGSLSCGGTLTISAGATIAAASAFCSATRSCTRTGADGRIAFNNNANGSNGLTRVSFGTEAASNPAFCFLVGILQSCDGAGTVTAGNNVNVSLTGNKVFVTSNFTTAANTSLQTITGLTFNFPATAQNWNFACHISYSQATATAAVAFGIQAATNAPTNIFANGEMFTAAGTVTTGTLATLTTTTATNIVSGTPGATATNNVADLYGTLELGASANAVNIMVSTATSADAVTVLRGSYCTLF